jgi:ArsR family transcriptional regulator
MEIYEACDVFSSLSQETRLKVFKLLITYGGDGLTPGKIAHQLDIPDNTLSFHLSHLTKSGLVASRKSGRTITYLANTGLIKDMIVYLKENCCSKETRKDRYAKKGGAC